MQYANVIINRAAPDLDRSFQYKVPASWPGNLSVGDPVRVPFGTKVLDGFVVELTDTPEIEESRLKELMEPLSGGLPIEAQLVKLAAWMKDTYGCTMIQALKTVIPVRKKVRAAKTRVEQTPLPEGERDCAPPLRPEQQAAADGIWEEIHGASTRPCLIYGVTGSGKTEVYMDLIARTIAEGRQAILLIPEISLTYQNLLRFYRRFGNRIAVLNSRLSQGEKVENLEKARKGEADLVIGPRSALFAPFPNLGLIIVDEEHESAYNSDQSPRYRAVDTAIARGQLAGAGVVLGSATPSMESFYAAMCRKYAIFPIRHRAVEGSRLPRVDIVDLREEMEAGNRSIFSRRLFLAMDERLKRKEQVILFLNRRGYAGFISCRACGEAVRCPHCDVSLTSHKDGTLICHYCGYRIPMPAACPSCGSPYLAGFGMGTQKVESLVKKAFPKARVLRMDQDTTGKKDAHSRILQSFAAGEADILIGTQMIVKGHDFPRVTLVGILAADLSLHHSDFRASERTFQLLVQAAGRAGRGDLSGLVIVQTYQPDHYAIVTAAGQDYVSFYRQELLYRQMLSYPPSGQMMSVLVTDPSEEKAAACADELAEGIRKVFDISDLQLIGPAPAAVAKVQDVFRRLFYIKHPDKEQLMKIREWIRQNSRCLCQADIL